MADYSFTVLAPTHNVGAFSCGNTEINEYLHNRALAEQALSLSQVYVMIDAASRVWGYGTLSPISVPVKSGILAAVNIAHSPYPAIGGYLLGKLGVDKEAQHGGVGSSIVARLAQIAAQQRAVTGGVFLAVDPKEDWLIDWYQKLGFVRLDPKYGRMALPLASVQVTP